MFPLWSMCAFLFLPFMLFPVSACAWCLSLQFWSFCLGVAEALCSLCHVQMGKLLSAVLDTCVILQTLLNMGRGEKPITKNKAESITMQ